MTSAPSPGWVHRQRAAAARRRPRCVVCGHRRVIETDAGPHCQPHADQLSPMIARNTDQEREHTMSTMSANTTDTLTFDDWVDRKRAGLPEGESYPMRQLIQYDSWVDWHEDTGAPGDEDGDALALSGTCDPQRSGTAVRVQIGEDTPAAVAVRLLRKVADWIERDGYDPGIGVAGPPFEHVPGTSPCWCGVAHYDDPPF